jgi:hypothetical protein
MAEPLVDFFAPGSPRAVSRKIEDYAQQRRIVNALVVPWESSDETLTMAVTSVSSDGWAIEHTNLGTIRLTDLGDQRTRVAVSVCPIEHPDHEKLAVMLDRFADQLRGTLASPGETA